MKELETALGKLKTATEEMSFQKPLEKALEVIREQTRVGFEQEQAPDGKPWKELSERSKQRKKKQGRASKKLQDKLVLVDSLVHHSPIERVTDKTLEYGTNVTDERGRAYAHFHQDGSPRKYIPQREFLAINDESAEKIDDLIADHVEQEIAKCFDA